MAAAAARRCASSGGLTTLSHALTKQLSATKGGARNLVFSPLSIHSALSLVAAGARGRTLDEFLAVLGAASRDELAENVHTVLDLTFPASPQPGGPRVAFACGLWHDAAQTLKPAYRYAAAKHFKALARPVDFCTKPEEARERINSWVASATNNLINSILEKGDVDNLTRVIVTNAIYFKGAWKMPFNKARTTDDKFWRLDGSTVDAKFMTSNEDQCIGTHDGFKMLRMPYAVAVQDYRPFNTTVPPRYSMLVVLPDAPNGLSSIEEKIRSSAADFLLDHMPMEPVKVGRFLLPKFKLSFSAQLNQALQNLGIKKAFSWMCADLKDMLVEECECCHGRGDEQLYLDQVMHKAVIEVNEEGTVAAAVTAGMMFAGCCRPQDPPPPVDFVADHPFAFFIVEEVSGAIVFAGHIYDPTKQ